MEQLLEGIQWIPVETVSLEQFNRMMASKESYVVVRCDGEDQLVMPLEKLPLGVPGPTSSDEWFKFVRPLPLERTRIDAPAWVVINKKLVRNHQSNIR